MSKNNINLAVAAVRTGGIIAYPTESVFGLGCDPFNQQAVTQLLSLKQRPVNQGLILIASHIQQILSLIQPKQPQDLARALKTWPGHCTWIFPKSTLVPTWISGDYDTVAIRVSNHPVVVQLCKQLNHALVSTSANISNQNSLNSIKDIKATFGDKIQFYLDAPIGNEQKPSTICDAHSLKAIR
ncbi:Threonylcarbamoyl-AMP synthase [hydrothermal vent metagenome]|uniref:L-threonylcarbamoyladenylate synthase n=1 Tax=hydrothermal vent metagenome TaxID=652676 RepID=A0A3B0V8X0_9ZZZZ